MNQRVTRDLTRRRPGRRWLTALVAVALVGPVLIAGVETAAAVDVPPVPTSATPYSGDQQHVVTDAAGNSYHAGNLYYSGTFGSGPNAVAYNANYLGDAFVASYDPSGALRWVIIGANVLNAGAAHDLALDGAGNVYVVGTFQKRISFGATTIGNGLGDHAYVLKVSDAGAVAWAMDITGTYPTARHVAASSSGAYLTGTFQSAVHLGGLADLTSVGSGSYLAHINAAGTSAWVHSESAKDVGILPSGDAVVLGWFDGSVVLGSLTLTSFSPQAYLARVGPTGSYSWARSIGDPTAYDRPEALSTDPSGRITIAITTNGTPKFGAITLAKSVDDTAMLAVARYNSFGVAQWAQRATEVVTTTYEGWMVMSTLADGAVVLGLDFVSAFGTPRFGDTGVNAHGTGSTYLTSIAGDGTFRWAERFSTGAISDVLARPATGFAVMLRRGGGSVGPSDIGQLVLPLAPSDANFLVEFPSQYTGPGANLGISVSGPTEATVGTNFTERITVRNAGLDPEPAATVTGLTSSGLVVVGAVPSKGSVSGTSWTIGAMAVNETATLDLTLRKPLLSDCRPTSLTVSVAGAVSTFDLETSDNTAVHRLSFVEPPQVPGGGLEWAQAINGVGLEEATDAAVGPTGDLFASGTFSDGYGVSGPATFAPDTPQAQTITSNDHTFLARYAADGTLRWVDRLGGPYNAASHVVVAADGSPIIGGVNYPGGTFDGKSLGPSQSFFGGFVAQYTATGALSWLTPLGDGAVNELVRADDGSIYVLSTVNATGNPASVTKLTAGGSIVWSTPVGSMGVGLAVDAEGVHVAGNIYGTATFGSGAAAVTLASNGSHDVSFADLDTDGNLLAAHQTGGPDNDTISVAGYGGGSWYVFERVLFNFYLRRMDRTGAIVWSVDQGSTEGGTNVTGHLVPTANGLLQTLAFQTFLPPSGIVGGATFVLRGLDDGALIDSSPANVAPLASVLGPGDRLYSVGAFSADVAHLPAPPGTWSLCNMSRGQPGLWDDIWPGHDAYLAAYTLEGSLAGTATDATNTPMGGITVTVMRDWPSWVIAGTTQTAADGTWRIDGLPVGRYRVRFRDMQERSGWLWSTTSPTYKAAADAVVQMAKTTTIDVALPALPDTIVAGRITDAVTGLPIVGAHIAVFDSTGFVLWATSGANGYYGIRGLPSKSYKLWIRGPNLTYVSEWFDDKATAAASNNVFVGAPGSAGSRVQANAALQPKV